LILLRLILYLDICNWVPSPQSIKQYSSWICNTCAVGFLPNAGIAELFPKMVSVNKVSD